MVNHGGPSDTRKIEHVVVLMYENCSFDHMLGHLPCGGQLTGAEYNLLDPADPASERVPVTRRATYRTLMDPLHDLLSVNTQLFGPLPTTADPAPMCGFVQSGIAAAAQDEEAGKTVMDCFTPARLPALSTLASEFCLCDRWFSSVPGPTWPNRFFVHAATSDGQVSNTVLHPYEMRTLYDSLNESTPPRTWGIYFNDIPHSLALRRLWPYRERVKHYAAFRADVDAGRLPNYTFIEPRYLDFLAWKANDHHPPHDVRYGEVLLADVYETLRRSRQWNHTLLIVLFDEHGGFFDRVSPPRPVPNPDGKGSREPPFAFDRLGVRVPAILVSPWIERGTVDPTVYEHASVPATVRRLFGLPGFLNARDAAAATFERVLTRETPRADAPRSLPTPRGVGRIREQRALLRTPPDAAALAAQPQVAAEPAPLSEFQETLVQLAGVLAREGAPAPDAELAALAVQSEPEAAAYVQGQLMRFLSR